MSGIIIFIVLAALVLWGAAGSIVAISRDGYRQAPARPNQAIGMPNRY